jgi:hypothetical protein
MSILSSDSLPIEQIRQEIKNALMVAETRAQQVEDYTRHALQAMDRASTAADVLLAAEQAQIGADEARESAIRVKQLIGLLLVHAPSEQLVEIWKGQSRVETWQARARLVESRVIISVTESKAAARQVVEWAAEQYPSEAITESTSSLAPPGLAEYLLWYLPKKSREYVIGDLEEAFYAISKNFGRRKAVIWYYYQVGASFWPFAVRAVQKLVTWGIFGYIGDLIRRVIT